MANYRCTRRRMKIKRARATTPRLPDHRLTHLTFLTVSCVCIGVAYFRVTDAAKSVVAIENAGGAINQIAPTTHKPRHGQPGRRRAEKRAKI
jgi:hypothetical protein